ncbi:MAG TPA: hypothetical protein PKE29_16650 [Phycisphaerales bacterium]|nr:hypothetical protein [Phycisphaerales bacterium]
MAKKTKASGVLNEFKWEPQPKAAALVASIVNDFLNRCSDAKKLSYRMLTETGTRFPDWIDHIQIPASRQIRDRLLEVGYTPESLPAPKGSECLVNELGVFPRIVLVEGKTTRVGIKVEFVADFLTAHQITGTTIEGDPLGQLRIAKVCSGKNCELLAIGRHGYLGYLPPVFDPAITIKAQVHSENIRRRKRDFDDDADGFREANRVVDAAIADIGRDWTCDLFFAAEREYWMRRNHAARVQFRRQDKLGLGWANHDHHTYRSSRDNFPKLIALWEKLGLRCRERFYAGRDDQWGAQVMEQPTTGIITFNDVDMTPEELLGDFSHDGFRRKIKQLGTVGLWVGLHGEAVLQAGMHHLEGMFDWQALVTQLEKTAHVRTMDPFTTFPYLRQAFTEGERWLVSEKRIRRLLDLKFIDQEQAESFRQVGAIGSHLENLERNDGFKGFNQEGVSDIIGRTDPRRQVGGGRLVHAKA